MRQEDCPEIEAILDYMVSERPAWAPHWSELVSKQTESGPEVERQMRVLILEAESLTQCLEDQAECGHAL